MGNIRVPVPKSIDGFCELYKKVEKLRAKRDLSQKDKFWLADAIDSLICYVGKTCQYVVANYNLSNAVGKERLPKLATGQEPGGLAFSQTLENLQKKFPMPKSAEDDEDSDPRIILAVRIVHPVRVKKKFRPKFTGRTSGSCRSGPKKVRSKIGSTK